LSVGVLANSMFLNDNTKFEFSYGGGLKGRYYFRASLEGPHLGVALEFLKSRTRDDVNRVAVNNLVLVPELEGGYRLRLVGSSWVAQRALVTRNRSPRTWRTSTAAIRLSSSLPKT
jgi:hypothetical protein